MTRSEILELINDRPDARGECDRCHDEPVELWTDPREPGEWQFCRKCWRHYSAVV